MDASSLQSTDIEPIRQSLEPATRVPAPPGRRMAEPLTVATPNQSTSNPERSKRRHAGLFPSLLQTFAALLWVPQAAAISYAIGGIATGDGLRAALWPAGILVLVGGLRACLDGSGSRLAFKVARAELSKQRQRTVAALSARSPLDIDRAPSGLAASVLAEQAEAVVPYLSRFRAARMKATVIPVAFFLCILPLSWLAALVLALAAPLIPVFMALIGMKAQAASEKQLAETGGINAFLLDRLRGLSTIRALCAVDATARRLRSDAESLRRRTMAVLKIAFLSSAVLELFAAIGVAMTAVYVGFHLLGQLEFGAWGDRLSLAEGLFILLLAPAFFDPLRELSAVWHDRASGEAAFKALAALNKKGVPLPGGNAIAATLDVNNSASAVRIDNLTFGHPGSAAPILQDFDLDIAAGEHVAILGPSGIGKSTVLSLIAGLATPHAGRITIGGTRLNDATAPTLRMHMAWISQHPHLFSGTLTSNISLGDPAIGSEQIGDAIKATALEAVALSHAGMPIGEGGAGLSGGEALRVALARAVAKPATGLILADEPTAHLDAETAAEIADGILALANGKTLIVATHDPVLANRMDRIIRFQEKAREVSL